MKRLVVLVTICLISSLVYAKPHKRAKPENYGTMRIQAEVFKRLIRHILPLNSESLVFLGVWCPYVSLYSNAGAKLIDTNLSVKRWAGHTKYTKMQSKDEIYKRRLAKRYRYCKSDSPFYGGDYLIITNIKWVTPQDVEVEARAGSSDWSGNGYDSVESYRFKLHKLYNRWRVISDIDLGGAG